MSRCPSPDELRLLLSDQLARREAEAVEAHVQACASCQETLERLTEAPADTTHGGRLQLRLDLTQLLEVLRRYPLMVLGPVGPLAPRWLRILAASALLGRIGSTLATSGLAHKKHHLRGRTSPAQRGSKRAV